MELFIFSRYRVRPGHDATVEAALRELMPQARREPGCLDICAFRSMRDPRLFYVHARWRDETAFELHLKQPYTLAYAERVEPLLEGGFDVTRTTVLD